jgi:hypothetical protein
VRAPFELEWMGGAAERGFRRARRFVDDLPWDALDARAFPAKLVDAARVSFTEGAMGEYTTAAYFATLLRALLEARAPIDLVGMAGVFVGDEMLHVELNARLAMALGGAAPLLVDFEQLVIDARDEDPTMRATELAVRVSCVGESLSVPMLAASAHVATNPLVRAVLERLARDEAAHARLGWLWLEHIEPDLDDAAKQKLARVAAEEIEEQRDNWRNLTSRVHDGVTSEGFRLEDIHALGWVESERYAPRAERAVADVIGRLGRFGIVVRPHATLPAREACGCIEVRDRLESAA